jgi:hypothetical protein
MPTVAEILRQTGLTDEQIQGLDPKVVTGFETVVTSAAEAQSKAELAQRAQEAMYAEQIAPALDKWGNDEANLRAQVAFYKTQVEAGKAAGFVPLEAPGFQTRSENGQFVAGANPVPGSPDQVVQLRTELAGAFSDSMWAMQEYQRLNSKFLPDDVMQLVREAQSQRLPFRDYVERKYDFSGRRTAIQAEEQKKHDDAIRAEVGAQKDREFTEKYGNNPNIRAAEPSRFSTLERAVKEGQRPDPLSFGSAEQRRANTRSAIQAEMAENATVQ